MAANLPDVSSINKPKKLKAGLFIPILILILIAGFISFQAIKTSDNSRGEKVNSKKSAHLAEIETIISEIESLDSSSLKGIKQEDWELKKNGILNGGSDKNQFPGLKNVRSEIEKGNLKIAKGLMEKDIFQRIANPLYVGDEGSEPFRKIPPDELKKIDPDLIFFDEKSAFGIIAESRYKQSINFINLYYSL